MSEVVDCAECKGACCEEFSVPDQGSRDDVSRWFGLHGSEKIPGPVRQLTFECRCTKLDGKGRCKIYSLRPRVCQDFEAGGSRCLEVLSRRRTIEERRRIIKQN